MYWKSILKTHLLFSIHIPHHWAKYRNKFMCFSLVMVSLSTLWPVYFKIHIRSLTFVKYYLFILSLWMTRYRIINILNSYGNSHLWFKNEIYDFLKTFWNTFATMYMFSILIKRLNKFNLHVKIFLQMKIWRWLQMVFRLLWKVVIFGYLEGENVYRFKDRCESWSTFKNKIYEHCFPLKN